MTELLLVDLDGVLRIWDSSQHEDAERAANLPQGTMARVAFSSELVQPAITGEITDSDWREAIRQHLLDQYPEADADLAVRIWSKPFGRIDSQVRQILKVARRRVRLFLITNATTRLDSDLTKLGLDGDFDGIVNSSVTGVAKPDLGIFHTALRLGGSAPSNTAYVDDREENVSAANAVGIRSHFYTGYSGLEAFLRSNRIID